MEAATPTAPAKKLTPAQRRQQEREQKEAHENWQIELKEKIIEAMTHLDCATDFMTAQLIDGEHFTISDDNKDALKDHFEWIDKKDGGLPMPGNLSDAAKLREFIESQHWIENEVPEMLELL